MRRFVSFACALALLFALAAPAGAAEQVVFNDGFDSFDTAVWGQWFGDHYGTQAGANLGTVTQLPGALALRPSLARGGSVLYSRAPQVTSLPATVKFRVRMSADQYRAMRVWVTPKPGMLDLSGSYMGAHLGEANHNWVEPIHVFGTQTDGSYVDAQSPIKNVVPTDVWLEGTLVLQSDSADLYWNGSFVHSEFDVAEMLAETGGLHLLFTSFDDYNRAGFDIDSVTVATPEAGNTIAADVRFAPASYKPTLRGGTLAALVTFDGASSAKIDAKSVALSFGDKRIPVARVVRGAKADTVQLRFDKALLDGLLGKAKGDCMLTVSGSLKTGEAFSGTGLLLVK